MRAGADVNARDARSRTVIHRAVDSWLEIEPWEQLIRKFLLAGAKIDAVDANGKTLLHLCVASYDQMVPAETVNRVRLVLLLGLDPNIRDNSHNTARDCVEFKENGWRNTSRASLIAESLIELLDPVTSGS